MPRSDQSLPAIPTLQAGCQCKRLVVNAHLPVPVRQLLDLKRANPDVPLDRWIAQGVYAFIHEATGGCHQPPRTKKSIEDG
jgi:hypothetical protein